MAIGRKWRHQVCWESKIFFLGNLTFSADFCKKRFKVLDSRCVDLESLFCSSTCFIFGRKKAGNSVRGFLALRCPDVTTRLKLIFAFFVEFLTNFPIYICTEKVWAIARCNWCEYIPTRVKFVFGFSKNIRNWHHFTFLPRVCLDLHRCVRNLKHSRSKTKNI